MYVEQGSMKETEQVERQYAENEISINSNKGGTPI